jgi:hypothetical protein
MSNKITFNKLHYITKILKISCGIQQQSPKKGFKGLLQNYA